MVSLWLVWLRYNTIMTKKQKAYYILMKMQELFPDARSELENWETPFQFLICIILSAQTTDAQVNKVTRELFQRFPDPKALGSADLEGVMKIIGSVNYYRNKAKNIVATARSIDEGSAGKVPKTIEELIKLPGVGLKTANVFLNDLYAANQGIGADTHVMRVATRLGLTDQKTPELIARDLEKLYKKEDWHLVNTHFVLYGRYVCKARVSPENSECVFKDICSHCGSIKAR